MASFIIHRPMPERFRSHLREAIETLGYYRIDALDQLLSMYRERWPGGLSSRMFRTRDIEHMLTEKGLADPDHAQAATMLRATFNLDREEFDLKEIDGVTGLLFWTVEISCPEARQRHQMLIHPSQKWSLPLPGCRKEWCPCTWTWHFGLG